MSGWSREAVAWMSGGVLVSALCGFIGFQSDRPDSPALGVVTAGVSALVMIVGHLAWRGEALRGDVSPWEFGAATVVVAVWSTILITVVAGTGEAVDGLFVLPPVGLLPLLVRRMIGDHGDSSVRARVAARRLHQFAAITLGAMGMLYVVTVFLVVLAPFPLIAASLHVAAVGDYRRIAGDEPADPRLGFMK